jgi:putative effector of murein hydrolase
MSPQEKLALGMSLFVLFFVLAFLVVPASAYQAYFNELRRGKRSGLIKLLTGAVFALSFPYFYDQLVGFDSRALSLALQVLIGACAYFILIDVAWFIFKNHRPSARR